MEARRLGGTASGGAVESTEDAALVRLLGLRAATRAQQLQIFLQGPQLADPPCDVLDVRVEQRIDLAAILLRRVLETQ